MQHQSYWVRKFSKLNAILLALVVVAVFVLPALRGEFTHYLYPPLFTAIFLTAAFTFSKKRKPVVIVAVVLTLILWISIISDWQSLKTIVRILQFLFFVFLVSGLIKDISTQPTVTSTVIVDAITGYLLLGFALSLFVTVVALHIPDAYNVGADLANPNVDKVSESIYYTFITFSTTGYGDILPVHPLAKSLAILIGISGQLYIAIIIAMLVGKYASEKN
jgi:hypothetical protein